VKARILCTFVSAIVKLIQICQEEGQIVSDMKKE